MVVGVFGYMVVLLNISPTGAHNLFNNCTNHLIKHFSPKGASTICSTVGPTNTPTSSTIPNFVFRNDAFFS
jgi:hypothetical protein